MTGRELFGVVVRASSLYCFVWAWVALYYVIAKTACLPTQSHAALSADLLSFGLNLAASVVLLTCAEWIVQLSYWRGN